MLLDSEGKIDLRGLNIAPKGRENIQKQKNLNFCKIIPDFQQQI
jgi:hypothetical protein